MDFLEIFQSITGNVWIYGGSFLLVLGILVFVHEWGHYIVARLCGIRVETFSIGFGHEIFGFNDRHGTRWKISLVPLGGYVKLFGDVDPASFKKTDKVKDTQQSAPRPMTAAEKQQAFFAKPVWQRTLVVFAGPAINYIFAIVLLAGLFMAYGQPVTPPVAAAIVKGSSADKAGFQPHDRVLSIDGKPVDSFEDIRRAMLIALDQEKQFVIERDGQQIKITATPEREQMKDRFGFTQSRGKLGLVGPNFGIDATAITAVNGKVLGEKQEITRALDRRLGQRFEITVGSGENVDVYIIRPLPAANAGLADAKAETYGVLQIAPVSENAVIHHNILSALMHGVGEAWNISADTLEAVWQMITGTRPATELGGIIRIGALAGDMAQQGIVALILFTALLSINLGLINLFPIPLLDGGHLVFYAFEAVLGRPIPEPVQEYAFRFGLAFLVCLMVFANLNDIVQLLL
ncbi:MAG: RIP metalloprotease RseP [Alphaproteobacteria bacterium]|nr:RIP metalloprotease RseP [Alphaproteobacteria bacterium]